MLVKLTELATFVNLEYY